MLDFGGDKTPPFLSGVAERGIELLLGHPEPLASQLRAILASAGDAGVRVLIPMVDRVEQLRAVARGASRRNSDRSRAGSQLRLSAR